MKKNLLIVTVIVLVILTLDQVLKIYIKSTFEPGEIRPIFGDWFVLEYIENQGMAFGTTFGASKWAKLALSVFRMVAISGIIYYLIKQAKKAVRLEFLVALGLLLAGATGNLIDSMFYDFIFPVDQHLDCGLSYNQLPGSGNWVECNPELYYDPEAARTEIRHTGFLFGNVVDMFKFHATWPESMPWVGGEQVFPAIWNLADASITLGVVMLFFRQRKYFPKKEKKKATAGSAPAEEVHTDPQETSEDNSSSEEISA